MLNPPTMICTKCGLFKTHPKPLYMQPLRDTRADVIYASPKPPVVLFVTHYPTELEVGKEDENAEYFTDGKNWLFDYLDNSKFEYLVSSLVLCYPGRKGQTDAFAQIKPTAKQVGVCNAFFQALLTQHQPQIIVALGGEVLKALWPESRGTCPSVTKARLTPIKLPDGRWLVTTYDPVLHAIWKGSSGRDGQDLTEEYIRVFTLLHEILDGSYKEAAPLQWSLIQKEQELRTLCERFEQYGVTKLYVDVETSTWLGSGARKPKPFIEDPLGTLPEKLTIFHPGARLMCFGVTAVLPRVMPEEGPLVEQTLETFVILPQAWEECPELLIRLINHKTLEAWNMSFDGQATYVLDMCVDILERDVVPPYDCGSILPPEKRQPLNITIDDGFIVKGLIDQSLTGNGLKPSAVEALSIPDWGANLDQAVERVRDSITAENRQRAKQGLPAIPKLVAMDMSPIDIWAPYNAGDTHYHARLREEKLHAGALGPDFPWAIHRMLLDGLGWIATMERNGVPVDNELFLRTLDSLEEAEADYKATFDLLPETQAAIIAADKIKHDNWEKGKPKPTPTEFNTLSPTFYREFVRQLHGDAALEVFPTTATGQLSSSAATIAEMAGEDFKAPVPWAEKTRAQRIWSKVRGWKNHKDDYARLCGLYDYVVDGRIHPSFRILRSDVEGDDEVDAGGGAVSGRIVSSPNVLNLWPRIKPIFRARPGYVLICPDYGRIELAWIAWNSQDPLMMQWSNEMLDQHEQRGRIIFETIVKGDWNALSKDEKKFWRAKGKTQNFATIYQEEPETTARKQLVPVEQVIADLELGRRLHPKILELQMDVYERCQRGEMIKTCFGRCRSPRLTTKEFGVIPWRPSQMTAEQFFSLDPDWRRQRDQDNCKIFRSLWNTRAAQSDASDTTFCAGKRIHKLLRTGKFLDTTKVFEINYQYDSLHYEVHKSVAAEAAEKICLVMADIKQLGLPAEFGLKLPVEAKVGEHYGEDPSVSGYMRSWNLEKGCYEDGSSL